MGHFFDFIPEGASTITKNFDILFFALVANGVFFAVLIISCMIIFSVKYRRRPGREKGDAIHGNLLLEITWTIIPLVIAMGLFVWGTVLFMHNVRPPQDSIEMFVVGKQWM